MTERKAAKKKTAKKSRKKGGLGAGGKSLELDRPMGEALSAEVEAPPPPPPPPSEPAAAPEPEIVAAPEPEVTPEPFIEPEPAEEKPPAPEFDMPPEEMPPAQSEPAPPPVATSEIKVDLDLLPWIVKKQLALDTDREDLDYEIYFWIEGKHDRLVLEGHRNDFGKLYVVGPNTPPGCWKRYADSEFAGTSAEDVFQTYRKNIVSVLVRTHGLEIEFSDLADFLEWANY